MRTSLVALAALLLAGPAIADDPKPRTYHVPYKLTPTNHVMVRLKLNGKGPFNFIMDTGAPALFVATKVGKKIGAANDKTGWATIESVELEGGLKVGTQKARVEDPFQLEGMNGMGLAGYELHGMIGYNILAPFKITYDFTSDKLTLVELPGFQPPEVPILGKGGSQGGMEFIGTIMKFLGPLMGFKGVPEKQPRGFIGIELDETKSGVVIKSVMAGSPADQAGIKAGDKLLHFSKDKIDRVKDLEILAGKRRAGDEINLTVERDGSEKKVAVTLGKGL